MSVVCSFEEAGRVYAPQLNARMAFSARTLPGLDAFPLKKGWSGFTAVFKYIELRVDV